MGAAPEIYQALQDIEAATDTPSPDGRTVQAIGMIVAEILDRIERR